MWIKQTNKQKNDKRAKGKAYEHINTEMLLHAQKFHKDKIKNCDIKVKMPVWGRWGNCPRQSIMRRKKKPSKYQWLTFCWAWYLALGMVYSPSKTPLKKIFFLYHFKQLSLGGRFWVRRDGCHQQKTVNPENQQEKEDIDHQNKETKTLHHLIDFSIWQLLRRNPWCHYTLFILLRLKKMQEEGKWIIK